MQVAAVLQVGPLRHAEAAITDLLSTAAVRYGLKAEGAHAALRHMLSKRSTPRPVTGVVYYTLKACALRVI
jgi:hypothetical protein